MFTDDDEDSLTYSVSSKYPGIIKAWTEGDFYYSRAINPASSPITYGASDAYGGYASRTYTETGVANVTHIVAENSPAGTNVGLPVTGTPYGGETLTYTLTGEAATSSAFVISSSTGQISVAEGATLDFETKNRYTGKVEWTVQGQKATANLTIEVTDLQVGKPDAPKVTPDVRKSYHYPALEVHWKAPAANGLTITGWDARYRKKSTPPSAWEVDSDGLIGPHLLASDTSGVVHTYESEPLEYWATYQVQVRAFTSEDGWGPWSDTGEGTAVPTLSGKERFECAEHTTCTVEETYIAGSMSSSTLTWSVAGDDAGDFSISSTSTSTNSEGFGIPIIRTDGVLTFQSSPDFENPADSDGDNVYEVTVRVSSAFVTATKAVSVTVTDVNEPPSFPDTLPATLTIVENSPRDTNIGAPFTAADPDKTPKFGTLTYSLSGDDARFFNIIKRSGQIRVKAELDYEVKTSYSVIVGVSDGRDASGSRDDSVDDTVSVTINVSNDARDDEDMTIRGETEPRYTEHATSTVATYMAVNAGTTTLAWSVAGDDAGDFNISGGALTFRTAPDFANPADSDTNNVYEVSVRVSNGIATSTRAVSVTVTDVNEPPTFPNALAGNILLIIENSPKGTNIGSPLTATDPDKTPEFSKLTYSLSGDDARFFKIVEGSGQLKVNSKLNYERRSSYSLTVGVSDGKDAGGSDDDSVDDTVTVTINVTDDPADDVAEAQKEARREWKKTGLTATGGHFRVILEWEDLKDPGITGYQYKYKGDGGSYGNWTDIPAGAMTTRAHTVTDVGLGSMGWGTYVFIVRPVTSSGGGPESNEARTSLQVMPDSRMWWAAGGYNRSISEDGGSAQVLAVLEYASRRDTTFTLSVSHPGSVTLSGNTLTVPAGETRSSDHVTITAVDNDVSGGTLCGVRISYTVSNPLGVKSQSKGVYLCIEDDD